MSNLELLTGEKILSISLDNPEKLYDFDTEEDVKRAYRKLASIWHPDKHEQSDKTKQLAINTVFAHIQALYDKSVKKFYEGTWRSGKVIIFEDIYKTKYQIRYEIEHSFDLGKFYISSGYITYFINKDNVDLVENGISKLENLKFANNKMKTEFSKYLPTLHKYITTEEFYVVVMKKSSNFLLLKDVLDYFDRKMPVKHVAWIISSLYNLACFLEYNKLMQSGISLENLYIHPKKHEVLLGGGWWFSHNINDNLMALSQEAVNVAPVSILNHKKANNILDLELIKLVGRKLLGDSNGVHLLNDKNIPKPISLWLCSGAGKSAVKEYEGWYKVLADSFGARRFTEMNLNENDIYPQGE